MSLESCPSPRDQLWSPRIPKDIILVGDQLLETRSKIHLLSRSSWSGSSRSDFYAVGIEKCLREPQHNVIPTILCLAVLSKRCIFHQPIAPLDIP